VNDSKCVSARRREALVPAIKQWADAWSIVHVPASVIDAVGIMAALSLGARQVAASLLTGQRGVILLDGNQDFVSDGSPSAYSGDWRVVTREKADATCASVAAASILAKVARDAVMVQLHRAMPSYGWEGNKGYGSAAHRAAIAEAGSTVWHRRTWRLLPD
jgi:ribonuclease HII